MGDTMLRLRNREPRTFWNTLPESARFLALVLCLAGTLVAQSLADCADISGMWRSTTGAMIYVPPYSPIHANFTIVVYRVEDGRELFRARSNRRAHYPEAFAYKTESGETILGSIISDKEVEVFTNDGTWQGKWTRWTD